MCYTDNGKNLGVITELDSCDSATSNLSLTAGEILGKVLYAHDLAVDEDNRFKKGATVKIKKDNVENVTTLPLYEFLHTDGKQLGLCRGLPWICSEAVSDVEQFISAIVMTIQNDVSNNDFEIGQIITWKKVLTKRIFEKGRGRGWKRGSSPKKWERNVRKKNRIMGKEYKSVQGKLMPEKIMNMESCNCKTSTMQCELVTEDMRKEEFDKLYSMEDDLLQKVYLKNSVEVMPKSSITVVTHESRKSFTRHFKVQNYRVCKKVFLSTYCISNGKLDRILKKEINNLKDSRGLHGEQKDYEACNVILRQIFDEIPKYDSHYHTARYSSTNVLFLAPHVTKLDIFKLFIDELEKQSINDKPHITWFYNHWSKNYPNIKIKSPKTDTCDDCNKFVINQDTQEKNRHLRQVNLAKDIFHEDSKFEFSGCFDMMSLLPLPQIDTSTVYYKRQLWVYTEDIHMIKVNKAHLYVWTEGTGNKGNKEIANILYLFIKQNKQIYFCPKRAIFWSDSTGSQNRCFTITSFFIWLVNSTELLEHVIHRFFYQRSFIYEV